jgi:hypothetical protein
MEKVYDCVFRSNIVATMNYKAFEPHDLPTPPSSV